MRCRAGPCASLRRLTEGMCFAPDGKTMKTRPTAGRVISPVKGGRPARVVDPFLGEGIGTGKTSRECGFPDMTQGEAAFASVYGVPFICTPNKKSSCNLLCYKAFLPTNVPKVGLEPHEVAPHTPLKRARSNQFPPASGNRSKVCCFQQESNIRTF